MNINTMKKQLRIITTARILFDEWSKQHYHAPNIPHWINSRHIKRRKKYINAEGYVVIYIDSDWCIHCFNNGRRMMSVLPF